MEQTTPRADGGCNQILRRRFEARLVAYRDFACDSCVPINKISHTGASVCLFVRNSQPSLQRVPSLQYTSCLQFASFYVPRWRVLVV